MGCKVVKRKKGGKGGKAERRKEAKAEAKWCLGVKKKKGSLGVEGRKRQKVMVLETEVTFDQRVFRGETN